MYVTLKWFRKNDGTCMCVFYMYVCICSVCASREDADVQIKQTSKMLTIGEIGKSCMLFLYYSCSYSFSVRLKLFLKNHMNFALNSIV